MRRWVFAAACSVLVLAACGESGPLDGVGDRTRELVVGSTTTTVPVEAIAAGATDEALIQVADVLWFNDDIDPAFTGASAEVVAQVWRRQLNSRFVQASRAEIAAAMPGVLFPELVPQQVRWITSQLVFLETSGTLDQETSAAFGLWTAEPYQSDRAQLGVLRVGRAGVNTPSERSELVASPVPDGASVAWTEAGHRYELFCRSEVSEVLCLAVGESAAPLALLTP